MIHPSTFSIAAYSSQEEAWGIAVASKFPAVGAVVPWAQAGKGAIATQAFANTSFGPDGLALLATGMSADETMSRLLRDDPGKEQRQLGIVDAKGASATFTGRECFNWAGGRSGPGYAVQGNILAGAAVVEAMETTYLNTSGVLAARLISAIKAGEAAGGDRRGRQSAAILVVKAGAGYAGFNDRMLDYRVDDDPDPVRRLGELLDLHELYFGKSPEEERVRLQGSRLIELQMIMIRLGYLAGEPSGNYDENTAKALRAFTGNENFEERCGVEKGWIDSPVLEFLLKKFK